MVNDTKPEVKILNRDECNALQWQSQSIFMANLIHKVLVKYGFPCQVVHDREGDAYNYHSILVGDSARVRCVGQFCDFELYDEVAGAMVTHSVNMFTIVNRLLHARDKAEERTKYEEEKANRPGYNH